MRSLLLLVVGLAWLASLASAQELTVSVQPDVVSAHNLTKEQLEPWTALKEQIALYIKRDWKEHDKYIHPKLVDWGTFWPSPILFNAEANKYFQQFADGEDKIVAHLLIPVSIVVAGDTAIINAYVHSLTKPEGKSVETIYKLHNTWKKENGRWQLLATYNSLVSPKDED
jgi:SnoaL-like domain